MSGGGASARGPVARLLQAAALVVVFGVMFWASRTVPEASHSSGVVTAMGFLLLAGMLASELLGVLGLPHLTGYLLAGAIAGPHVLHLVPHDAVKNLSPVNTLALSLIALAGGAELRIDLLRRVLRSFLWSTFIQSSVGIVTMGVAFVVAAPYLGFTASLSGRALAGVALIWGVLSISRSPAATLAIFSQLRPDGPVSRFSLAFVMASDVVVVALMTTALAVARPLVDPAAGLSLEAFRELGHELLGSVSLGTTLGLLLAGYLWLVGSGLLVVLMAIGFGLTEALHYLRFDPLLTFLVAGFVVANFSDQGEKLLAAVARVGNVVYVVFFATAGAHLDLPLLRQLWPVALFLSGARFLVVWLSHRVSARLAGDEPVVRAWGWAGLVSQAGLTIGLSVVVERSFPSFGPALRSLVLANVAMNEIAGPVLFKLALDRAGESRKGVQEEAFHAAGDPAPEAGATAA